MPINSLIDDSNFNFIGVNVRKRYKPPKDHMCLTVIINFSFFFFMTDTLLEDILYNVAINLIGNKQSMWWGVQTADSSALL